MQACVLSGMAWEWVSDVSLATLGVAGMGFTYYTAKRQREQNERLGDS